MNTQMNFLESPDNHQSLMHLSNYAKPMENNIQMAKGFSVQDLSPLFKKKDLQVIISPRVAGGVNAHTNSNAMHHNELGEEEMHGIQFSSMSRIWQKPQSPCISQDASPLLFNKPLPNNGYEWSTNYASLANASRNNQSFLTSEHSAFKKGN